MHSTKQRLNSSPSCRLKSKSVTFSNDVLLLVFMWRKTISLKVDMLRYPPEVDHLTISTDKEVVLL